MWQSKTEEIVIFENFRVRGPFLKRAKGAQGAKIHTFGYINFGIFALGAVPRSSALCLFLFTSQMKTLQARKKQSKKEKKNYLGKKSPTFNNKTLKAQHLITLKAQHLGFKYLSIIFIVHVFWTAISIRWLVLVILLVIIVIIVWVIFILIFLAFTVWRCSDPRFFN